MMPSTFARSIGSILVAAILSLSFGVAEAAPANKHGVAKVSNKAPAKKHAKKPAKKHKKAHSAKRA